MILKPEREHYESYRDYFDAMIEYHRAVRDSALSSIKMIDKKDAKKFSSKRIKNEIHKYRSKNTELNQRSVQDILENRPVLMKMYKQGTLFS